LADSPGPSGFTESSDHGLMAMGRRKAVPRPAQNPRLGAAVVLPPFLGDLLRGCWTATTTPPWSAVPTAAGNAEASLEFRRSGYAFRAHIPM
jgi:hypothetical protein